ncbi:MAG TPA: CdaR family protein [Thermoanaerobaculia bacterium]|nr:CdaR family protein [Thermoanaerobaculia bacterium]
MSDRSDGLLVLRVMAAAIALLLWLFVTLERRGERPAEKVVEASVTYNPPPGMILLNPVDRVRVRLRGSEETIRRVNPYAVDVQVEIDEDARGVVDVHLEPENVLLPEKLEVVSIEPSFLRLQLDEELRRLLPVRVKLVGEPAAGSVVAGRPRVRPEQVLVTGPSRLLSAVDHLETSPVSLNGHALDFEESALLVSPDPLLKVQTQVVSVSIPMRQPQPVP